MAPRTIIKLSAAGVGVIVLLILIFGSVAVVPSGYIGITTTFGKVTGELQPGVNLKWPIVQSVTAMNVQVQNDSSNESAATNDLQNVSTNVTLNYHLDHAQVDNIFVNLTANYQANLISPTVSEVTKAVTADYTASQLLTDRAQVTDAIEQGLVKVLEPRGILVDQVSLTNFQFSSQFTQAVEAKNAAQQSAEQAQYNLQKAQLDAQANQVQDAALTPSILEQQAIAKWNGVMPTTVSGSASIFSIPVGQ